MDLDARPYRCFVAVAETGSFRRAAERLHMSQPALSAQIRELERRLGFDLFLRSSRSVSITSEGHLFLPNAKRIVAETEIVNRAAFDIRTNQLRIGAPVYTTLIPERAALIRRFLGHRPDVSLRILNDSHVHNLAALRDEESDLVFALMPGRGSDRADEGAEPDLPRSMQWHAVAERPVMLSLPAEHPLVRVPHLRVSDLRGLKIARLGRVHGRGLSDMVWARFSACGADPVRPPEGNIIAVEQFAREAGIAAVALGWIAPEPDGGPPRVVREVSDLALSSCLALIRNRGLLRPGAQAFWEMATADRNILSGMEDGPSQE